MWRWVALALTGLSLLILAACGGGGGDGTAAPGTGAQGSQASNDEAQFELTAQDDSGETGTATLTPAAAGKTRVVVEIVDATSPSQPAYIHRGTCADLDPTPLYGLVNVQDGRSETVIDAPLTELTAGGLALNVHQSDDELDRYVACGTLPGSAAATAPSDQGPGY